MKLQPVNVHKKSKIQSSKFDDVLVIDDGSQTKDNNGKAFESGCKVTRNQDKTIYFALSCPTQFKIVD